MVKISLTHPPVGCDDDGDESSPTSIYRDLSLFRDGTLVMIDFRSYWDDSKARHVWTMAGLVGSVPQWDAFDPLWSEVLNRYRVSRFHATDFVAHQDEFAGWCESKRRRLISQLTDVLSGSGLEIISATIYREALARANHKWGHSYDDYPVASALCMYEFRNRFGPSKNAEVFLDRVDNWRRLLDQAEALMESDPLYGPWWREEHVAWRAFTKQEMTMTIRGKEAADFAAWEFGAQLESKFGLSDRGIGGHWSQSRRSAVLLAGSVGVNARGYDDGALDQLFDRIAQGDSFPIKKLPPV
jgi:hypothetical protein